MSAKFDMLDPDSARVDGRETTCRTMQSLDIRIRGIRPFVQHSCAIYTAKVADEGLSCLRFAPKNLCSHLVVGKPNTTPSSLVTLPRRLQTTTEPERSINT